jgi:predicted PurR-regulated permease PerM
MPPTHSQRSAKRALFILLLGSIVLVCAVMEPLAVALFLAVVIASALWPIQVRLTRLLRGREKLAGGILVSLVLLVALAPLFGLSAFVVNEAVSGVRFVSNTVRSEGVEGLLHKLPESVANVARKLIAQIPKDPEASAFSTLQQQVSARGGDAAAAVGAVVATTGTVLFQSAMMLIGLFYFLTQSGKIMRWIDDVSPLRRGQTRELIEEFRRVTSAVLRSTIYTALVQAVVAFMGYLIAKVPYPLFFGAVTFFIALIPAVGAASVCLLAALLMLISGHPWAAVFLVAWGIVVVGLVDNVVKPFLIKGDVEMHGAVVFFALLGGLAAFGAVGLLLGPLAVALFVALLRIYRRDYGSSDEPVIEKPAS